MTLVETIMTANPTVVEEQTLSSEAARMMRDADVGLLPVVRDGKLLGVVTDRDLAIRTLSKGQDCPVGEVMTENPVTLSPGDSSEKVEKLMAEHQVRRLVVCDKGSVVGVVSVGDLAVQMGTSSAGEVMQETGPDGREAPKLHQIGQSTR